MSSKKALFVILGLFLFFLNLKSPIFAGSDYVLPYPSFMPGSRWYIVQEIVDGLQKYWYFGSFAQFKYNLSQSDKYIVEAKTLFEYKQYLLGYRSLEKSNKYFETLPSILKKAEKEKKSTAEKQKLLNMASLKHIETLNSFSSTLPETFEWKPEKELPTTLNLQSIVDESIKARRNVL